MNFFFDLKIKVVPESAITLFSLVYVHACTHKHTHLNSPEGLAGSSYTD